MQSYSIYIPRRMRNFRLHHQMSKNISRSTNFQTCRTKGNKIRPEDPSTIVPAGKKKVHCSCCFSFWWFCPFSPSIESIEKLLTSCHWQCCCWLASPQKPPDFSKLESANFGKPQNAGIFAASDLHPKKKAMTQLVVFGVRVWSFILKRFST